MGFWLFIVFFEPPGHLYCTDYNPLRHGKLFGVAPKQDPTKTTVSFNIGIFFFNNRGSQIARIYF